MGKSEYVPFDPLKYAGNSTDLIALDGHFRTNNITTFNITNNGKLKRIQIGNDCFGKVRVFYLDGLSELESVVIGVRSFTYSGDYRSLEKRSDGDYRIVNCPKLQSIQIGDYSFSDYNSFELSNLASLQTVVIGEWCFYYAPSFSLTGLIGGLV